MFQPTLWKRLEALEEQALILPSLAREARWHLARAMMVKRARFARQLSAERAASILTSESAHWRAKGAR